MIRDELTNVSYKEVQEAAMGLLNNMQHLPPAMVLHAVGWLFLAVCRHYRVAPRVVLEATGRVMNFARDKAAQYPLAIDEYCREELPRGD
jgi:hypothetical protein